MKKIILSFLILFISYCSFSQCPPNSTERISIISTNDGFVQLISNNFYTDEYVTISNILNTDEYEFVSTHLGGVHDYITVTDVSNVPIDFGMSPLTLNNINQAIIRVHIRANIACDTDIPSHTLTLQDLTNAPTCYEPDRSSVVASYLSKNRLDFNWSAPSMGTPVDYDWEIVLSGQALGTGFSGFSGGITNATSGEVLTEDTPYDLYIRSDCGGGNTSVWIAKIPFRTLNADPPPNDFCSGAISVLEQTGIPDASSAVSTAGDLLGGAGTDVITSPCGGGPRDDVWYKFVAKTTDANITVIPNSNVNFVVSLFSGTCNSLNYLACSGDASSPNPPDENIYYSSLTIGQTYYIRTYYYTNSTSADRTFNLKIWSTTPATDVDNDGYVASLDCNDNNASIYPGAPEVTANGIDENCDGMFTWYQDNDSDGFGSTTVVTSSNASPGAGESASSTDCDDSNASIYPGASEVTANGIDENCDGMFTWYQDLDGDGYGSTTVVTSSNSSPGSGESSTSTDCNDGNASIHPGASEVTANGIDENCDGMFSWYQDLDGDGYGSTTVVTSSNASPGSGESANSTDCDDIRSGVNPGATEIEGNGLDDDCNPSTPDIPLGIDEFNFGAMKILPNPFNQSITIHLPVGFENDSFDVSLFDLNGRRIYQKSVLSSSGVINIDNLNVLQQGLYFIRITNKEENKSVVRELIKY